MADEKLHIQDIDTEKNDVTFTNTFFDDTAINGSNNSDNLSLQEAFRRYREAKQNELRHSKHIRKRNELGKADQCKMAALRQKFVDQAKKYFGYPYAKKYWPPDSPEYNCNLFLDCCGLVRRVMRDLADDFGFIIGPWNQAYMYDTLPITIEQETDMKPGDLVFISATYYNPKAKKQRHNLTHVEIWAGDGTKTIGARWNNGKVQVFDSYRFVPKSYHSETYHFKSIDTWLQGINKSYCPEHRWIKHKYSPSKKSIFALPEDIQADQAAGDEEDNLEDFIAPENTFVNEIASVSQMVSSCSFDELETPRTEMNLPIFYVESSESCYEDMASSQRGELEFSSDDDPDDKQKDSESEREFDNEGDYNSGFDKPLKNRLLDLEEKHYLKFENGDMDLSELRNDSKDYNQHLFDNNITELKDHGHSNEKFENASETVDKMLHTLKLGWLSFDMGNCVTEAKNDGYCVPIEGAKATNIPEHVRFVSELECTGALADISKAETIETRLLVSKFGGAAVTTVKDDNNMNQNALPVAVTKECNNGEKKPNCLNSLQVDQQQNFALFGRKISVFSRKRTSACQVNNPITAAAVKKENLDQSAEGIDGTKVLQSNEDLEEYLAGAS